MTLALVVRAFWNVELNMTLAVVVLMEEKIVIFYVQNLRIFGVENFVRNSSFSTIEILVWQHHEIWITWNMLTVMLTTISPTIVQASLWCEKEAILKIVIWLTWEIVIFLLYASFICDIIVAFDETTVTEKIWFYKWLVYTIWKYEQQNVYGQECLLACNGQLNKRRRKNWVRVRKVDMS